MKQIPPFKNRREVFYLVHKEPTSMDENGIYIVKPKDNSYRALWAVVWGIPLKLMSTSDGYSKEEINTIVDDIKKSILDNNKEISLLNILLSKLDKKKADKDDLDAIGLGLIPKGEVELLSDLNSISNPKDGWAYIVKNQKDEFGNMYIYRYDSSLSKWINTKLISFNPYLKLTTELGTESNEEILTSKAITLLHTNYYISQLFKESGIDNSYKYTLKKAIDAILENYGILNKRASVISLINNSNEYVEYINIKNSAPSNEESFTDLNNWLLRMSEHSLMYEDLLPKAQAGLLIDLSKELGEKIDLTAKNDPFYEKDKWDIGASFLIIDDCKSNDVYQIKNTSGIEGKKYGFIDKDNILIKVEEEHEISSNTYILVAPANAVKFISNFKANRKGHHCYKINNEAVQQTILKSYRNSIDINKIQEDIHSKVNEEYLYDEKILSIKGSYIVAEGGNIGKEKEETSDRKYLVACSDFIQCPPNSRITYTRRGTTYYNPIGLCLYDSLKKPIKGYPEERISEIDSSILASIESPSNCSYLRTTYWDPDHEIYKSNLEFYLSIKNQSIRSNIDDLNDFKNKVENIVFDDRDDNITFEQGGILGSSGNPQIEIGVPLYENTIRTSFIKTSNKTFIDVNKKYSFSIYYYNKDYEFLYRDKGFSSDSMFYKNTIINHNGYIRLVFYKNPWGLYKANNSLVSTGKLPKFSIEESKLLELKVQTNTTKDSLEEEIPFEKIGQIRYKATSNEVHGASVEAKNKLFESKLENLKDTHDIQIQNIGKDQSGTYDMFGYIITPKNGYKKTIAFTAHIHGDERLNPMGLIVLFDEMSNPKCSIDFVLKSKKDTRWIGIFMCNPYGYSKYVRLQSRGVNLNRNFDYAWSENKSDESNTKGDSIASEQETKNIIKFFKPYLNEINIHMDWHDQAGKIAYYPALNRFNYYDYEILKAREWLEKENYTPVTTSYPYVVASGGVTNQFADTWGIPSITSEQSRAYWSSKNIPIHTVIMKSFEMTLNYHIALLSIDKGKNTSPYYDKYMTGAFRSEELAMNTWKKQSILSRFNDISIIKEKTDIDGYTLFENNVTDENKLTVLVVGGYKDYKNISSLTILRSLQEAEKCINNDTNEYVVTSFANLKIYICPFIENDNDIIEITRHLNQSLTIYVKSDLVQELNPVIKYNTDLYMTSYLKDNYKIIHIEDEENQNEETENEALDFIEKNIETPIISISNNEEFQDADKYSSSVAKWVKVLLNSIASIYMKKA